MVETHVQALRSLLEGATSNADPGVAIECKHFFSGAAAYADGRIFMTLTSVGLALKLPDRSRTALLKDGAAPLRYFPKGPIKKDYVLIPDRLRNRDSALAPWILESIRFCRALPMRHKAKRRSEKL